ncbi:MAG: excinuclease ABC subunit C, partial [Ruminococcus sp.]|nr:excinuclease ABC subunit C [Ruminococcus sp.]
ALEYIRGGEALSVEKLTMQMEAAAEELNFELAARIRDRIKAIERAAERQKIVDEKIKDCDCIAIVSNSESACASVIMYRGGRLYDKADFFIDEPEEPAAMLAVFIMQYYSSKEDIPRHIFLSDELSDEDRENIIRYLKEKTSHAIYMTTPQKGDMLRIASLAKQNASEYLSIRMGRTGREVAALDELAKALGMEKVPKTIECYDISNLASSDMVAGMVVFENGRPLKKHYRRFVIKDVDGQNDYASMQEVLRRRFENYFKQEDECFSVMPDLIFLDGGKGHVNTVTPVVREMGIDCPIYGLVKDDRHRTRAVATGGGEISLTRSRAAFNLVTAIQDEVHRYSVAFMTKRHKKTTFASTLTTVKGVGEKKAAKLIGEFKTKEKLKAASLDDIKRSAGVNEQTALELMKVIEEM